MITEYYETPEQQNDLINEMLLVIFALGWEFKAFIFSNDVFEQRVIKFEFRKEFPVEKGKPHSVAVIHMDEPSIESIFRLYTLILTRESRSGNYPL